MLTKWLILHTEVAPIQMVTAWWCLLSFKHGPPSFRGDVPVCMEKTLHGTCRWARQRQHPGLRTIVVPSLVTHRFQPAPISSLKRPFLSKCALLSPRQNPTLTVPFHSTYMVKIKVYAKSTPVRSRVLSHREFVQVNASQLRFPPSIQIPCQLYHPKIPALWRVMQFAARCFPDYLH